MSTPTAATKASASKSASKHSAKPAWNAPSGSWEDEIQAVDTIEKDEKGLHVYLKWNDGRKTRHSIEQTYVKCPLKVHCPFFSFGFFVPLTSFLSSIIRFTP